MARENHWLAKAQDAPQGSDDAERHVDQKDSSPVDGCENSANDRAHEKARRECDGVYARSQPNPAFAKGICHNCGAVCEEKGPAHALNHAVEHQIPALILGI